MSIHNEAGNLSGGNPLLCEMCFGPKLRCFHRSGAKIDWPTIGSVSYQCYGNKEKH